MKNFCVFDHQGKTRFLTGALLDRGWQHTPPEHADVLLLDIDDPDAPGRSEMIDRCPGRVVLYPHGGLSAYDGYYQPDDRVDVHLVHGPQAVPLVEQLGLSREVKPVGWSYSPWVDYTPPREIRRVLFGPIHPYGSGFLFDELKQVNARVFTALQNTDVEVTVQMFGTPAMNGTQERRGVTIVRSSLVVDWRWIDQADLVVADGTLACLALARGKPVVMFGQEVNRGLDEHNRPRTGTIVEWPRYPIDFDDAPLPELFTAACDDTGGWWRDQFVGGPFDKNAFLDALDARAPAHGTVARYGNAHQCRCDKCRAAATAARRKLWDANPGSRAAYMRDYRKRKKAVA